MEDLIEVTVRESVPDLATGQYKVVLHSCVTDRVLSIWVGHCEGSAIALGLENQWTAKLNRAVAAGAVDGSYARPTWYHAQGHSGGHFSSALAGSFDSAIASSSVAPGSSSGSSGGGGGGGGGGGW